MDDLSSLSSGSSSDDDDDQTRSFEVTRSPSQEEMLPLLECPVCFELPLPPIKTCLQGHIICSDCSKNVIICPLCRKRIGIGRNFFAEDFVNRSYMKCKYYQDGCQVELRGGLIRTHLEDCEFRPLKCCYCDLKVPYKDFVDHYLNQHHISQWEIYEDGTSLVNRDKEGRRGRGDSSSLSSGIKHLEQK